MERIFTFKSFKNVLNVLVQKFLFAFIFIAPKLENIFGLSQFQCRLITPFIQVSFIVLYPVSCKKVLRFLDEIESSVTANARNLTFVFNCLVVISIYLNETFNFDSRHQSYKEIETWFSRLVKRQSLKQNFVLLCRCSLKGLLLASMLQANYAKVIFGLRNSLEPWERCLMFFILQPFIALCLASNRIYVANTIVKHFLILNSKELELNTSDYRQKLKLSAISYRRLHEFFIAFHKVNVINLIAILSFYIVNIIYQVNQ